MIAFQSIVTAGRATGIPIYLGLNSFNAPLQIQLVLHRLQASSQGQNRVAPSSEQRIDGRAAAERYLLETQCLDLVRDVDITLIVGNSSKACCNASNMIERASSASGPQSLPH
jgi:hypothetical protein